VERLTTGKQTQPPHNIGNCGFVAFCGFLRREMPQKKPQKRTKVTKKICFVALSDSGLGTICNFGVLN